MIGKNIKTLRHLHQLNQQELAVALNIKQSTIANYEKDIRTPNLETMIAMADYFGVSLDDLVGRTSNNNLDMITLSDEFLSYLLQDEIKKAEMLAIRLLENEDLITVYFKLFRYALSKLGWLWEVGEVTISKEHQVSYEISRMISHIAKSYQQKRQIKSNGIKILGMAAPGEKHNIGLKMTLSVLELEGYETMYIGEAVPKEDLKEQLNRGDFNCLILSITNFYLKDTLLELVDELGEELVYISGNGAKNIMSNKAKVYPSYLECLEAIQWQTKALMKDNQK
jgi:transcriptional regulator with XRE-family HTH domain